MVNRELKIQIVDMTMKKYFVFGLLGALIALFALFILEYRGNTGFYKGPFPEVKFLADQTETLWLNYYPAQDGPKRRELLSEGMKLLYLQWFVFHAAPALVLGCAGGLLCVRLFPRKTDSKNATVDF